jgi:protein-tyrosine phosphatase
MIIQPFLLAQSPGHGLQIAWRSQAVRHFVRDRSQGRNVSCVIDLHCHVLPGIDDGPRTVADSLDMALIAAADGIETIVATPHVNARYRNSAQDIVHLVEQLLELARSKWAQAQSAAGSGNAPNRPPELLAGAEVAAAGAATIPAAELERLTIAGGGWLLLEPPFNARGGALDLTIGRLRQMGLRVILAHPERCTAFHRDPERLRVLVRAGVITSLTASSLSGRFGEHVRRFARWMLEEEIVHNIATDGHNCFRRPPRMSAEIGSAGLAWMSDWLAREVPLAVISGSAIPPPPPRPRSLNIRRTWRGLGGRRRSL